ncbi:MAG: EamA family transporter [Verrucomicrobiota bacterium]|nr:EamA family transporter [Verrucomicrobiota bacterium]
MSFAIVTALLFAFSAICNTKVSRLMDQITANLIRLLFATFLLGIATLIIEPHSFHPEASMWLIFSGIIGFGIGDIALFLALSKIGSRLTILINFCTATLIGALSDWIWLDDSIKKENLIYIFLIFAGLSFALYPKNLRSINASSYKIGILAAIIAGLGQGMGASISRHATAIADYNEIFIGGTSQAFQRVLAGSVFLLIIFLFRKFIGHQGIRPTHNNKPIPWLILASLFGPVLGVSCFQASLMTMTSGESMAIVATSPILLIPLALFFEKDKPTVLSVLGGTLAVAGVIGMALSS